MFTLLLLIILLCYNVMWRMDEHFSSCSNAVVTILMSIDEWHVMATVGVSFSHCC